MKKETKLPNCKQEILRNVYFNSILCDRNQKLVLGNQLEIWMILIEIHVRNTVPNLFFSYCNFDFEIFSETALAFKDVHLVKQS